MSKILFKDKKPKEQEELEQQVGPKAAEMIITSKEKKKEEGIQTFHTFFKIDLRPKLISIPPFENKKEIDIRYPLIAPYAYAHIYWDNTQNELLYEVEEPQLSDTEQQLLKLIKLALEEMINVSFINSLMEHKVISYLEKNVQSILTELGTKVTKKTYLKAMYYIYRDYVGLNLIEPLLKDYFIEDIECNGIKTPIYIVHRKYENIRTNVTLQTLDEATNFVEKLAQKCGRYVSFARPLLDGTLPDGSRVNATYSEDVTTRGPTFTIRKFTKNPWTPIHLINYGTSTPLVFAYIWLAIEHKFNIIVVGETGSGKTTFLNSFMYFIPPESRVCSIEDTREINLAHENWLPAVVRLGYGIPNILGETYGGVSLFDLLKESFRQNPDYVIVGEIRGQEASVLFQGMASGHPSFGTFHAASVETLTQRLQTPPINLSASLVKSLDIVCVTTHVKGREKNFRRMTQLNEIIDVKPNGEVKYNTFVEWDPANDTFGFSNASVVLNRITERSGIPVEKLSKEMAIRAEVLGRMLKRHIINFKEFTKMINLYYKNPSLVLQQLDIKEEEIMPMDGFTGKEYDERGSFTGHAEQSGQQSGQHHVVIEREAAERENIRQNQQPEAQGHQVQSPSRAAEARPSMAYPELIRKLSDEEERLNEIARKLQDLSDRLKKL
ncbi:type II/IV secretion system ATPase subunit [Candidatus Woesearchaeota archaeon]|nr:type II/IV secretion system ATPase subunit [Candidatus Woesearchaeota archaeon]